MAETRHGGREGATVSSELPTPLQLLTKKTVATNNILVGEDGALVRFTEAHLGRKATVVDRITDESLTGYDGLLLLVSAKYKIDISPEVRDRTGRWAAEPIVKGSSAVHALVKFAATLIDLKGKKLDRETVDYVSDEITRHPVTDVYGAIWSAVWMLTGEIKPKKRWVDPWEAPIAWLEPGTDPSFRMHTVSRKLVGYASYTLGGAPAAEKLSIKPSQMNHYKNISLDKTKVYRSIELLSKWRQGRMDVHVCAVQVAAVWS